MARFEMQCTTSAGTTKTTAEFDEGKPSKVRNVCTTSTDPDGKLQEVKKQDELGWHSFWSQVGAIIAMFAVVGGTKK